MKIYFLILLIAFTLNACQTTDQWKEDVTVLISLNSTIEYEGHGKLLIITNPWFEWMTQFNDITFNKKHDDRSYIAINDKRIELKFDTLGPFDKEIEFPFKAGDTVKVSGNIEMFDSFNATCVVPEPINTISAENTPTYKDFLNGAKIKLNFSEIPKEKIYFVLKRHHRRKTPGGSENVYEHDFFNTKDSIPKFISIKNFDKDPTRDYENYDSSYNIFVNSESEAPIEGFGKSSICSVESPSWFRLTK